MTDRERLAELEARHRKVAEEITGVRRALRGRYAAILLDLPVESLTEKEFRELMAQAIRVGANAAIAALAPLQPK
jgi:hypothetical protein